MCVVFEKDLQNAVMWNSVAGWEKSNSVVWRLAVQSGPVDQQHRHHLKLIRHTEAQASLQTTKPAFLMRFPKWFICTLKLEKYYPEKRWGNYFCKGPDSKHFRLCTPEGLWCKCSTLSSQYKQTAVALSHPRYLQHQVGLDLAWGTESHRHMLLQAKQKSTSLPLFVCSYSLPMRPHFPLPK